MKSIVAVLMLALFGTPLFAQNQGDAATIRVVASNKAGAVRNLTSKNFKVSVDNRDRPVLAAAIPPAGKHAIFLLFDNTTINAQDQANIRGYAENFITAAANHNLYMAVATFRTGVEVLQSYTTEPARLKAALVGTAASSVANTVGGTTSASTSTTLGGRATGQRSLGDASAGGDQVMKAQAFAESLRGVLESMAPIRGAKAVFLFSGGQAFSQDAATQVDAAIAAANRAGVTIYGISNNTAFAKTFADPTGGSTFKITQYMADSLKQITDEMDSEYDLKVDLSDSGPSTGCHTLRVRVDADGVDVRTPKTFCLAVSKDALAGTEAGRTLDTLLAGQASGRLNASAQAFWHYRGDGLSASVIVALDVPAPGMTFQRLKNKFHGELSIAGVAYRPDGAVAARFSETVAFDFDDRKQAEAFATRPYHYENQLELGAGRYTVKAVMSSSADAWGKTETAVEVAGRNAAKLDMSGIALARELRAEPANMGGLDPGMLENNTSLIMGGRLVVPAGQVRFKKSDKVYLYAEISDPSLKGATPEMVGIQYRIVDRASGDVRADSGVLASVANFVQPGSSVISVATVVATTQLAPGAYRLELRAAHTTGSEDVVRSADFELYQ